MLLVVLYIKRAMKTSSRAFTRLELLAVFSSLVLLCLLALPALANTRAGSQRAGCFNNLRQVGQAVRQWADEHAGNAPWLTSSEEGGTLARAGAKVGAAWFEYLTLSNHLSSPAILTCPADSAVRVARRFDFSSIGLAGSSYRANAISYMVGLHCEEVFPKGLVGADANMGFTSPGVTDCGKAWIGNAQYVSSLANGNTAFWSNALHAVGGHVLTWEGSVAFTTSSNLGPVLINPQTTDNFSTHLLKAR